MLESTSVSYGKATPTFPCSTCSDAMPMSTTATPRAPSGQSDRAAPDPGRGPPGRHRAAAGPARCAPRRQPLPTLDPPQRRQRTLTALKRVLLRESQVQPVLVVFEDLHWIDTETQALLDSLVESLPTAAAPGQLSPRVSARLGEQDVLHAAPPGPLAAGQRRRLAAGPARG